MSIQVVATIQCDGWTGGTNGHRCERKCGVVVHLRQGNDAPDHWEPELPDGWRSHTPYFQGHGNYGSTEHFCPSCLETPGVRARML